jgi:hypothetical protein
VNPAHGGFDIPDMQTSPRAVANKRFRRMTTAIAPPRLASDKEIAEALKPGLDATGLQLEKVENRVVYIIVQRQGVTIKQAEDTLSQIVSDHEETLGDDITYLLVS